ncbi:hypothetical protein IFT84_10290 [Rhizobium sp. CFBP 8762]|uniref:hypothetical protein n=1 Tax=Rhizobium sp. CFBP 8762 TaxID=2775279 RepID=UPI00177D1056|nr:hypothetical protein [Rhizobium sp. CFBP 8762]MBD8554912.1 hypothetical protein [Rhizobium sp. CFBP 8762]
MVASNDLTYVERKGDVFAYPVLAGVVIYGRAAVGITANRDAVPAGHPQAVKLVGLAEERVDNRGGATGDRLVNAKKSVFAIPLTGATAANIGSPIYASADDTFTLSNANGVLPIGILHAIDSDGIWLKIT